MPIRQKRSLTTGSIPTTASLVIGELAMNIPDGRIFFRKSGSGSDTIQSAITTGAANSGSVSLTGSLSIINTSGSVLDIAGDILEFSGDVMEFTGSFRVTGSFSVSGSRSELFRVTDATGSGNALATISSGSINVATFTTSSLQLSGSLDIAYGGDIQLPAIADPAAAPADNLTIYAKNIGGRIFPKWVGPSGVDTPFQPNIMFNNISFIVPGGGTTITQFGCTTTQIGTVSHPTLASTNLKSQTRRFTLTSATTAGASGSVRVANLECWRGNTAGFGGFFVNARFGLSGSLPATVRSFVGLVDSVNAITIANPLTDTTLNKIGMAITSSTHTWQIIHNTAGSTPTIIPLGSGFPADGTTLYELVLFCRPTGSSVDYRVTNFSSSLQVSGSLSTNLPASTTFLARYGWVSNGTTAAAASIDISRFSLESDY